MSGPWKWTHLKRSLLNIQNRNNLNNELVCFSIWRLHRTTACAILIRFITACKSGEGSHTWPLLAKTSTAGYQQDPHSACWLYQHMFCSPSATPAPNQHWPAWKSVWRWILLQEPNSPIWIHHKTYWKKRPWLYVSIMTLYNSYVAPLWCNSHLIGLPWFTCNNVAPVRLHSVPPGSHSTAHDCSSAGSEDSSFCLSYQGQ